MTVPNRVNGKQRRGAIKPKTMTIKLSEAESERLQIACWLLDTTTSGLLRLAVDQFLAQHKEQIAAALKAKHKIKGMTNEEGSTGATGEGPVPAKAKA